MSLDFDEYQEAALRTYSLGDKPEAVATAYLTLGLVGEAGEVAELVKKAFRKGEPVDALKLREELGDVLWYVANLLEHFGQEMGTTARENIQKLKKRYPQGYTKQADLARVDVRDRALARQIAPELEDGE